MKELIEEYKDGKKGRGKTHIMLLDAIKENKKHIEIKPEANRQRMLEKLETKNLI